jgi:SAM-dependent methyltransferase
MLSERYLHGDGIEIGALHYPLPVPASAHVRYIDRMSVPDLRAQYPELGNVRLVEVDVIDDGETLRSFDDDSVDFVIANHFLEHCEDPIGALANMLRTVRAGGVVYVAVPDKNSTFDRDRPLTPFDHVVRDHLEGPAVSRHAHFDEWVRLVDRVDADRAAEAAAQREAMNYSIHYHVWNAWTITEFVVRARDHISSPFVLECAMRNVGETIVVLRREDS